MLVITLNSIVKLGDLVIEGSFDADLIISIELFQFWQILDTRMVLHQDIVSLKELVL